MDLLGKFLLKIASILLFVISVSITSIVPNSAYPATSEEKPESIVLPVAILGEVSDIRRKILQNTLNETITTKFRIVPQERFEEACLMDLFLIMDANSSNSDIMALNEL